MLPEFANRLFKAIRPSRKSLSAKRIELSQIRLETIFFRTVFKSATTGLSKLYTDHFNEGSDTILYKKNCTDPIQCYEGRRSSSESHLKQSWS